MSAVDLKIEVVGDGPPVVVLHGLFGAGRNWITVARALAGQYRFHLVDLRNHGGSPHTDTMTYTDMVEDVARLVERLGLDAYTLVGHSMGGKAAMTLALGTPRGLRRLVNVDIAPVTYPDRFVDVITALQALDLETVARRADADRALQAAIPETAVRLFILQNLLFEQGRAHWRLNLATLKRDMPHILGPLPVADDAHYDGPTWFIRGELSDRITDAHLPRIARWFPNYHLETVLGGGHWPHSEAPAAFMAAFARALDA
ncbi:MAG: alpha/beta fold hydrolase [Proteobacteria bacterium]|nr:alpha/beta fold hydrolase [Pseudomonadota bacterium]